MSSARSSTQPSPKKVIEVIELSDHDEAVGMGPSSSCEWVETTVRASPRDAAAPYSLPRHRFTRRARKAKPEPKP